jgi:hypothetical protein
MKYDKIYYNTMVRTVYSYYNITNHCEQKCVKGWVGVNGVNNPANMYIYEHVKTVSVGCSKVVGHWFFFPRAFLVSRGIISGLPDETTAKKSHPFSAANGSYTRTHLHTDTNSDRLSTGGYGNPYAQNFRCRDHREHYLCTSFRCIIS